MSACYRIIAQTRVLYESHGQGGEGVHRINELLDRTLKSFTKLSDNRRAAVLGVLFGLLMCVIVVLSVAVLGFVATLGE